MIRLEKCGLCDHGIPLRENSANFTAEHGKMVARHHAFITGGNGKTFKSLKGAERDNLTKVQKLTAVAGQVIVNDFIHNSLFPYLGQVATSLKNKTLVASDLLDDSSCLSQLPATMMPCVSQFSAFSGFMKELTIAAVSLCHGSEMTAEQAQQWHRKWNAQVATLVKVVKGFEASVTSTTPLNDAAQEEGHDSAAGARLMLE